MMPLRSWARTIKHTSWPSLTSTFPTCMRERAQSNININFWWLQAACIQRETRDVATLCFKKGNVTERHFSESTNSADIRQFKAHLQAAIRYVRFQLRERGDGAKFIIDIKEFTLLEKEERGVKRFVYFAGKFDARCRRKRPSRDRLDADSEFAFLQRNICILKVSVPVGRAANLTVRISSILLEHPT